MGCTHYNITQLNFPPEAVLERRAIKVYGLETNKSYEFKELFISQLYEIAPLIGLISRIATPEVLIKAEIGNVEPLSKVIMSTYYELPELLNRYINSFVYRESELKEDYFYHKAPEHLAIFIAVQGLPETINQSELEVRNSKGDGLSVYESLTQIIEKGIWEGLTLLNYRDVLTKRQFVILSKICAKIELGRVKRFGYATLAAIAKGLGGEKVKIDFEELFSLPLSKLEEEIKKRVDMRKSFFHEKYNDFDFVKDRIKELGLEESDFIHQGEL